jgi:anaerobic selenocysteine-containing dehydrogenase
MLTRRDLLNGTLAGSAALVAGAAAAQAFSVVPMPLDVKAAYALRCGGNIGGHDELMKTARLALDGAISSGQKPVGAQEIVVCPICGCKMVVSADSSS